MKRSLFRLGAPTVLVLLAGCGPSGPAPDPASPRSPTPEARPASKGTIGFSALTLKNPFFKIIADNLTAEAQKHGFEVIVCDAERDVQEQSKHVENFLA
jgi:ribose transport system substrate-binding protein